MTKSEQIKNSNWMASFDAAQKAADEIRANPDYVLRVDEYAYDLSEIHEVAQNIRNNFKHLIVLGTGGSSLTGQALCGLVNHRNKWSGVLPKVSFLDNIDPETVQTVFDNADIKQTCFLVISKSGGTMETLSQLALVMNEIADQCGESSIQHQVFAISDPGENPLRRIAAKFNIRVLEHNSQIGGRYSIFTNVALLPAAVAGLDIVGVIDGARNYYEQNLHNAALAASAHVGMIKNGIQSTILMPYIDRLRPMVNWWRQIWAESLGRNGIGITPIAAAGTVDQHSQLQLYLDGFKDKSYTLITMNQKGLGQELPYKWIEDPASTYMSNLNYGDLITAAGNATFETMLAAGLPARNIEINSLDEEILGAFAMQFILETILTAKILGVNPYGQPAVEESKKRTMEKLVG